MDLLLIEHKGHSWRFAHWTELVQSMWPAVQSNGSDQRNVVEESLSQVNEAARDDAADQKLKECFHRQQLATDPESCGQSREHTEDGVKMAIAFLRH